MPNTYRIVNHGDVKGAAGAAGNVFANFQFSLQENRFSKDQNSVKIISITT